MDFGPDGAVAHSWWVMSGHLCDTVNSKIQYIVCIPNLEITQTMWIRALTKG